MLSEEMKLAIMSKIIECVMSDGGIQVKHKGEVIANVYKSILNMID